MATIHRLPTRRDDDAESIVSRLGRLLKLEMELGVAETKAILLSAAIAVAVAVTAAIALIAAIVVLLAGALAPLFDAPWQHLIIAGGAILLLAIGGLAWSVWRLRTLRWPKETLISFEETWRWLVAQVRSRLTLP
jgi:hypothetical protein